MRPWESLVAEQGRAGAATGRMEAGHFAGPTAWLRLRARAVMSAARGRLREAGWAVRHNLLLPASSGGGRAAIARRAAGGQDRAQTSSGGGRGAKANCVADRRDRTRARSGDGRAAAAERAGGRLARGLLLALGLDLSLGLSAAGAADELKAGDLAAAAALYEQGEMLQAAALARRTGTADGLVLAAAATLVDALYRADLAAKPQLLERAIADARQALALAPDDEAAYLQLAIALGALADWRGPIAAHLNGYAKEGQDLLLRARQLAPDDPWPDGLLGIWHLQIVRHGSAALAAELYGASAEAGLALCRRAAARAPAALALRYGCAVSLLEVDPERFGREALGTLAAIVRMPAADAAERLVQQAARQRIARFSERAAP